MIDKHISAIIITALANIVFVVGNISPILVMGESMNPTFHNYSIAFLSEKDEIEHNQIVMFVPPSHWQEEHFHPLMIKRVVAVEGDFLLWKNGKFYVNREEVKIYDTRVCNFNKREYSVKVPAGKMVVFGDNTNNSFDSRMFLCRNREDEIFVPMSNVVVNGDIIVKA